MLNQPNKDRTTTPPSDIKGRVEFYEAGLKPKCMAKKRYFIVFYEAGIRKGTDKDGKERGGGMVSGNIPLISTSGKYVNMKNVEKLVFDSRMDKDGKSAFVGLVFRSILELDKKDFNEFIR